MPMITSTSFSRRVFLGVVLVTLAAAIARAEEPLTFQVGEFTFTRPLYWPWVPVNATYQAAELKVQPETAGPMAAIRFFEFGGPDREPDSKANFWKCYLRHMPIMEKLDPKQYFGTKVTFSWGVTLVRPSWNPAEVKKSALFSVVMEGAESNVYVQMLGPEALVKTRRLVFDNFIAAAAKTRK